MTYEYSRIRIQDWGQGTFSGTIVKTYEEIDWKGMFVWLFEKLCEFVRHKGTLRVVDLEGML
jgi:hypothetical protein